MQTWEFTWFGVLVRIVVTAVAAFLFSRLLREGYTTARVNSVYAGLVALGVMWLFDIEGATRIGFLGIEIDKRVESAQETLRRLGEIETAAKITTGNLERVHQKARKTTTQLRGIERRLAPRSLSQKEIGSISQALRPYPGRKIRITRLGDREAGPYADQFIKMFKALGWAVEIKSTEYSIPLIYGIHYYIPKEQDPAAQALTSAFHKAGIKVKVPF